MSDSERAKDLSLLPDGVTALPVNLPVTPYGKAVRARDRFRTYLRGRVAADNGSDPTALAALHTAQGPQSEQLTDDELTIELLHFFFAAHGGLTAALAWLLVVLGEHPSLAQRLRTEADEILGDGPPTMAEVRQLPLARRVSREVLRAYPIVVHVAGAAALNQRRDELRVRAWLQG